MTRPDAPAARDRPHPADRRRSSRRCSTGATPTGPTTASIFFRIASWPAYGRLARLDPDAMRVGERVEADEYGKDDVRDFALWKGPKPGEPSWDTAIGPGRPGWHIECSAMSMAHLGPSFDVHTGGVDLVFPHHEDEIAQSEAATGQPFVRTWLHCAHLRMGGEKMAKSTGNIARVGELVDAGVPPRALRYALLSVHYRAPLNYSDESLAAAAAAIERIDAVLAALAAYREDRDDDPSLPGGARRDARGLRGGARRRPQRLGGAGRPVRRDPRPQPADRCAHAVHGRRRLARPPLIRDLDTVLGVAGAGGRGARRRAPGDARRAGRGARRRDWAESDRLRDALARARGRGRGHARRPALAPRGDLRWLTRPPAGDGEPKPKRRSKRDDGPSDAAGQAAQAKASGGGDRGADAAPKRPPSGRGAKPTRGGSGSRPPSSGGHRPSHPPDGDRRGLGFRAEPDADQRGPGPDRYDRADRPQRADRPDSRGPRPTGGRPGPRAPRPWDDDRRPRDDDRRGPDDDRPRRDATGGGRPPFRGTPSGYPRDRERPRAGGLRPGPPGDRPGPRADRHRPPGLRPGRRPDDRSTRAARRLARARATTGPGPPGDDRGPARLPPRPPGAFRAGAPRLRRPPAYGPVHRRAPGTAAVPPGQGPGRPDRPHDRPVDRAFRAPARPYPGHDRRPGPPSWAPEPLAPALTLAEDEELVAGRRPVEEAFVARREARRLLVVPQRRHALEKLVLHATSLRIPVVEVEGGTLTAVAGFDGHQGIALVVGPRALGRARRHPRARAASATQPPLVLVLDSLEDPQNVGTLLRTAEASGVHGAIFPTHHQAPLTPGGDQGVRRRRRAPAARAGRRPAGRARRPPRAWPADRGRRRRRAADRARGGPPRARSRSSWAARARAWAPPSAGAATCSSGSRCTAGSIRSTRPSRARSSCTRPPPSAGPGRQPDDDAERRAGPPNRRPRRPTRQRAESPAELGRPTAEPAEAIAPDEAASEPGEAASDPDESASAPDEAASDPRRHPAAASSRAERRRTPRGRDGRRSRRPPTTPRPTLPGSLRRFDASGHGPYHSPARGVLLLFDAARVPT